jgi:hypothetical protein
MSQAVQHKPQHSNDAGGDASCGLEYCYSDPSSCFPNIFIQQQSPGTSCGIDGRVLSAVWQVMDPVRSRCMCIRVAAPTDLQVGGESRREAGGDTGAWAVHVWQRAAYHSNGVLPSATCIV